MSRENARRLRHFVCRGRTCFVILLAHCRRGRDGADSVRRRNRNKSAICTDGRPSAQESWLFPAAPSPAVMNIFISFFFPLVYTHIRRLCSDGFFLDPVACTQNTRNYLHYLLDVPVIRLYAETTIIRVYIHHHTCRTGVTGDLYPANNFTPSPPVKIS